MKKREKISINEVAVMAIVGIVATVLAVFSVIGSDDGPFTTTGTEGGNIERNGDDLGAITLWYLDGTTLRPVDSSWGVDLGTFTIGTLEAGIVTATTTGATATSTFNNVEVYGPGGIAIGTTATSTIVGDNATSTLNSGLRIYSGNALRVSDLVSCDTVDTDANGFFECGSDETGAGAGDPFAWTPDDDTGGVATTTLIQLEGGFISNASSTIDSNLTIDGALSASSTGVFGGLTTLNSGLISSASSTIASNLTVDGALSASSTSVFGDVLDFNAQNVINAGDILFQTGATGGTLSTGQSNADKFILQGYDVDDATYRNVFEIDAGNTVTYELNEDGNDIDFRVEGTGATHLIFGDAGQNFVGIGTSTPGAKLAVDGDILGNIIYGAEIHATSTGVSTFTGGISIDSGGNLVVTDLTDKQLLAVDSTGTVVSTSTAIGTDALAFGFASSTMSTTTTEYCKRKPFDYVITQAIGTGRSGSSTFQITNNGSNVFDNPIQLGSDTQVSSTTGLSNIVVTASDELCLDVADAEPTGEAAKRFDLDIYYTHDILSE